MMREWPYTALNWDELVRTYPLTSALEMSLLVLGVLGVNIACMMHRCIVNMAEFTFLSHLVFFQSIVR